MPIWVPTAKFISSISVLAYVGRNIIASSLMSRINVAVWNVHLMVHCVQEGEMGHIPYYTM